MEEFIKNFGIDWVIIVAQIVNFLIVLYVLKRFLYKPIMDVLKKRKDSIEEGLKQSEDARLLMEKAAQKEEEILKQGREEARKLLNEAKEQSRAFLAEAEADARVKEQRILEESKKQITLEMNQAEEALSKKVVSLATKMIRESKTALFTEEDQERVMKRALEEIKKKG